MSKTACVERGVQYGWRLVRGRAKYICYHLYALPKSLNVPTVPVLRTRQSEYGIEIIITVAFLHYWTGISLDHVCSVVQFFTGLELKKSQVNVLLNQLSSDGDEQYDTIAELLSRQRVIYIDETGWKVGLDSCYTWAFSTAMHVLFRCGVGRGKAEAEAILGQSFEGIGVTDDYGAYQALFLEHQLCWAHLLRKAAAYGWQDLALEHGFHETKQGLRFTISEAARREVLDRLLALNHERYAEEVKLGLNEKKKKRNKKAKARKGKAEKTEGSEDQMKLFF